jgi:DNA repair protein RecO (recombination protein O)
MRVSLQPAHVIHRRPFRDSSLIVELFSPDYGRVAVVAKGARSGRSRGGSRSSLLQPFAPLLCSWTGRSELKTLTGCEADGAALMLQGERLYSGLYVNELVSRLLHHEDPHPGLYADYRRVLDELSDTPAVDLLLRRFEFGLLEALGYAFDIAVDGRSGEAVQSDRWYVFHPDYGLVASTGPDGNDGPRFAGADLLALGDGGTDAAARRCAKRLMRRVLAEYLGERPLKSRELFARQS